MTGKINPLDQIEYLLSRLGNQHSEGNIEELETTIEQIDKIFAEFKQSMKEQNKRLKNGLKTVQEVKKLIETQNITLKYVSNTRKVKSEENLSQIYRENKNEMINSGINKIEELMKIMNEDNDKKQLSGNNKDFAKELMINREKVTIGFQGVVKALDTLDKAYQAFNKLFEERIDPDLLLPLTQLHEVKEILAKTKRQLK